jgi:hypothetical protein
MSDFDPAEQIVTAKQLAHAFDETPAQIVALTRLGILRPVHLSEKSLTSEPRYEFLGSLRAYLRHWRAHSTGCCQIQAIKPNSTVSGAQDGSLKNQN